MNIVDFFLEFVNKFLGQAPLLMGTVVLIGYLLLGKKIYEAVGGFIKAYVGFKILQVGTGGLVSTFTPILTALTSKFDVTAYVIDPYYGQASAETILGLADSLQFVGVVMIIAFAWNIALVALRKFTKIRTLFITGHIMYQQSAVLLWALYWVLGGATGGELSTFLIVITGFLMGTYWSVASNLIIEPTQEVTDGAGFTVGHQQMMGSWLAYKFSKLIGNPDKDINDTKLPGFMSVFNDNVVANVLIMGVFVGTIMLIIGADEFAYDRNKYLFGTYIFEQVAMFAVYITIIQTGVRMFVTELTASFQGISEKLLPGSVPAVDCAVTFGFSPNAPTYGFIFGFFGQMLAIGTLIALNSPIIIIAGFICLFFDNGTLAVYANKAGGRRAAMIIPFLSGMIQVFGSALVLTVLQSTGVIGWMGMFDWATLFAGTVLLTDLLGIIIPILLIVGLLIIPQVQYMRSNKENYFTTMREN